VPPLFMPDSEVRMRITRIESYSNEHVAVVRVRADSGAEGIGQTAPFYPEITVDVLHKMVAPPFLGANPWDVNALTEACLLKNYKFTGTFLYRALCGVETALWDLMGQVTGQPVYRLLGGKVRDRIPVYASSMARDTTPEQEVRRVTETAGRYGFRSAKIKIGGRMGGSGEAIPGRSERLIPFMREALGDDFGLIADANGSYTAHEAIRSGRLLQYYNYSFFEEPCNFMDLDSTAQVSAALDIPVAGGEQDNSLYTFDRMIRQRIVGIVQPDIGYIGGVGRARRVAELAALAGIPCTPHCSNPSMLQVFTAHLVAAMPACYQPQEYRLDGQDHWAHRVYEPHLRIVDGMLHVPEAPGWGIRLLPEFIRQAASRVSRL
jgi:L-alanine-DL-glutamate epimerase-like enolase superfamily enzyme